MSHDWMGFLSGAYDGRARGPHDGRPLADQLAERDALRRFKEYVHARLDAAGVPADPDSPHRAEGCRIGGRLDLVLARWAAFGDLLAACEAVQGRLVTLAWDIAEAFVEALTDPGRWAITDPDIRRGVIEHYLPIADRIVSTIAPGAAAAISSAVARAKGGAA